jgi:hypothetical protein
MTVESAAPRSASKARPLFSNLMNEEWKYPMSIATHGDGATIG